MHSLKKKSEDHKCQLLELKDQSDSFHTEKIKLLHALASVENAKKLQKLPSLDENVLLRQIKEQEVVYSVFYCLQI